LQYSYLARPRRREICIRVMARFAKLVGAGPVRPVFRWVRSGSVHESVGFPPLNGAYNFYLSVNRPA
jgi:hypothetical protein